MVEYADALLTADFAVSRRIIVLTEGNTDKRILERSLNLLYPHLSDYFRGAGELIKIVKAFSAAGLINRILDMFDNDTAAKSALGGLKGMLPPDNIVVLKYPALESAINYPTLGPTGVVNMDVNRLAGSIELYFGNDVFEVGWKEWTPKSE